LIASRLADYAALIRPTATVPRISVRRKALGEFHCPGGSGIFSPCRIIAAIGFRGGTFFFTANLLDRRSDLLVRQIGALRDAVRRVRSRKPFRIDAWVVLPDHMHCLWTLPQGDANYAGRWRAIKIAFVKGLPTAEPRSSIMSHRGECGIWQRRYWEHTIRDDRDFAAHMDYIHFNPVKHGLAGHPADWPYSSFRRCVDAGLYPIGWQHPEKEPPATGERLVGRMSAA
jgi:putative transposase